MKTKTSFKKGHSRSYYATGKEHSQYKHGMASQKNPLYRKWTMIKRRCYNKNDNNYKRYGGVGIVMSDEWKNDFMKFYNDMSKTYFDGASIDRIDNNKGYSKENCRWVTLKEQGTNRRTTNFYTLNGVTMSCPEWEKKLGLGKGGVRYRINILGWSIEKAITTNKIQR